MKVDSHIFNWWASTKIISVIGIVGIVRVVRSNRRVRHKSGIWDVGVLACDQAGTHCPIVMLLVKQVVRVKGTCAGRKEGQPWQPHAD